MNRDTSNSQGARPVISNLRLTAKLIPIIAPFIAKNDIRYYLSGVNVRPHKSGGAIICATNGHALGAIHDREAICDEEVTLRLDARMLQSCAGNIHGNRIIKVLNDRLVVVEGDSEAEAYIQAGDPVIDPVAAFPRYERVIPELSTIQPGLLGSYSADLVALLERAATAAAKSNGTSKIKFNGIQFFNVNGNACGSAVARIPAAEDFIGVIMPMRADAVVGVPSWCGQMAKVDDLAGMGVAA
ncbi:hypothetical protein [Massilia sp. CCM 8734]|uniref:hypothetical protein n=1 Tax=Massilia sp. CCM 8734 TaxID=2609283 RepID=UPI001422122F|nr:hypothetical protein [Massilia sp. CCM 8734]NHZ94593.1 hypothetical protein [Massilia sp. CCM 8734]